MLIAECASFEVLAVFVRSFCVRSRDFCFHNPYNCFAAIIFADPYDAFITFADFQTACVFF